MLKRTVLLDTAEWRVYTRQIPFFGYGQVKVASSRGPTNRATSIESTRLWRVLMELQAVGRAKSPRDPLFVQVLTDFAIALHDRPKATGLFSGGAHYSLFF
jgi:hypothetical protein